MTMSHNEMSQHMKLKTKTIFQIKVNIKAVMISCREKQESCLPLFFHQVQQGWIGGYITHKSQAPCDGVSSVRAAYFSSGHILPLTPPT